MARTVEVGDNREHFLANGDPVTVSDGAEGTLTAVVGVRYPSADGYGQIVFFWHDASFLGWNSDRESVKAAIVDSRPREFVLRFANYTPTDPLCCPSLPPVTVAYRWSGARLVPTGTPPEQRPPTRVERLP